MADVQTSEVDAKLPVLFCVGNCKPLHPDKRNLVLHKLMDIQVLFESLFCSIKLLNMVMV
jgi:hypothetical protein